MTVLDNQDSSVAASTPPIPDGTELYYQREHIFISTHIQQCIERSTYCTRSPCLASRARRPWRACSIWAIRLGWCLGILGFLCGSIHTSRCHRGVWVTSPSPISAIAWTPVLLWMSCCWSPVHEPRALHAAKRAIQPSRALRRHNCTVAAVVAPQVLHWLWPRSAPYKHVYQP